MDVEAKVKEIIIDKLGVEESQITPEASFTNDLGVPLPLPNQIVPEPGTMVLALLAAAGVLSRACLALRSARRRGVLLWSSSRMRI